MKTKLCDKVYPFAEKAHQGQIRRYTGEPYILHPIFVAKLVATSIQNMYVICAALLHDVVEMTDITIDQITAEFGPEVGNLVLELTDHTKPEDGNRAYRKEAERARLSGVSNEAKTIKLADLIHNTKEILQYDPKFSKVYLQEAKELLPVLEGGEESLHYILSNIVEEYFAGRSDLFLKVLRGGKSNGTRPIQCCNM